MLTAAGVALDLGRPLVVHGDDDMVGDFAALGTTGFNGISGRKSGVLHGMLSFWGPVKVNDPGIPG